LKSSRSGGANDSAAVAHLDEGMVAVRDYKNPTGPALVFTSDQWDAFLTSVAISKFGRS